MHEQGAAAVPPPDAARRLAPAIRAARAEADRDRRLPPAIVAAMHKAGLFRLFIPAALGGVQADILTSMRVVEEVARADGAAGWNLMIGTTYGIWAARLAEPVAREIYSAPDAVVAGALRPTGTARAVDGGYVVNGRWAFASGIHHSAWWLGGCVVVDGDTPRRDAEGKPVTCIAFFPASHGELIDTWDVLGLRATGSHDYAVRDLFVPAERTTSMLAPPRIADPLYRLPLHVLLDSAMATVPLGIARTAIDAVIELAAGKRSHGFSATPAERATVQADIARAEALLRSARAWLYETVAEAWDDLQAGREVPVRQTALLRLARVNAQAAALQAVDLVHAAAGGSSIYAASELERCFRDAHTAAAHTSLHVANYEVVGRVLVGLPSGRPVL